MFVRCLLMFLVGTCAVSGRNHLLKRRKIQDFGDRDESLLRESRKQGTSARCIHRGRSYSEGESAEVFKQKNEKIAYCKTCSCSNGKFRNCREERNCEIGYLKQLCEEIIYPPNQCCPSCKREKSCGGHPVSDTWMKRRGSLCFHCECLLGGNEQCTKVQVKCLKSNCKNPVYTEDSCCPQCAPATTSSKWLPIKLTTTEEPFFPFSFPFDSNEKP